VVGVVLLLTVELLAQVVPVAVEMEQQMTPQGEVEQQILGAAAVVVAIKVPEQTVALAVLE